MNNIYDLYPRYCLACENKEVCWENHWSITIVLELERRKSECLIKNYYS